MKKKTKQRLCDEQGRIIINMTVKDDSEFLSRFSQRSTPVISSEVAQFLENSVQGISPKDKLHLRIHSDQIDDREKTIYTEAIEEYYFGKTDSAKRELHHNTLIATVLAAIGIIILAASMIMEGGLWPAVLDIVAWVFLWEVVDISAFKKRELRINRYRYKAFTEMEIEYKPLNERYRSEWQDIIKDGDKG